MGSNGRRLNRQEYESSISDKSGEAYGIVAVDGGWAVRRVRFDGTRVVEVTDSGVNTKPIALFHVFEELERMAGL